jgi:carbamate kinase
MLVVVALGGNALLRREAARSVEDRRASVRLVAQAIAPVAAQHQIVIAYGDGPDTEGMIGYMIEQELGNLLPFERPFATVLTMVEVDHADPAFRNPSTVVGPDYDKHEADRLSTEKGWVFKQDGDTWRRVVASPDPKRIFEMRPVKWLLERNTIVIAAGAGGMPTMYEPGIDRRLVGVDCAIDRDLASELIARQLGADVLVMLTDVDAVYVNWNRPTQAAVRRASPAALDTFWFAAGSMGPKVRAACRFAQETGRRAAIGSLTDLREILAGDAGTTISTREAGIVFAPATHTMADGTRG